jgi:hypothetical protein
MAEKSSRGLGKTDGKNLVWFGEIGRKLAKLSMPNSAYCSSSLLFYDRKPFFVVFSKRLECSWTEGYSWKTALILSVTLGGFGADRSYSHLF